jgi:hypothetical protein
MHALIPRTCMRGYTRESTSAIASPVTKRRNLAQMVAPIGQARNCVHFGQLLGMSDHLTFTLGQAGYKAYKYLSPLTSDRPLRMGLPMPLHAIDTVLTASHGLVTVHSTSAEVTGAALSHDRIRCE